MKSVFDANPTVNIFYVFEDGNAFTYKGYADSHKMTTKQEYKIVEREKETEEKPIKNKK
jgi:hypothetical protein